MSHGPTQEEMRRGKTVSAYRRHKKRLLSHAAKDPDFKYTRKGRLVFVTFKDLVGTHFNRMSKVIRKWTEVDILETGEQVQL